MFLGLDGDSRDEPAERRGLLGLAGVGRAEEGCCGRFGKRMRRRHKRLSEETDG